MCACQIKAVPIAPSSVSSLGPRAMGTTPELSTSAGTLLPTASRSPPLPPGELSILAPVVRQICPTKIRRLQAVRFQGQLALPRGARLGRALGSGARDHRGSREDGRRRGRQPDAGRGNLREAVVPGKTKSFCVQDDLKALTRSRERRESVRACAAAERQVRQVPVKWVLPK